MLECHYGVPMCQAVLHAINTRLDAKAVAFQLEHADSKIVIADREFMPVLWDALQLATVNPLLIQYHDPECDSPKIDVKAIDYDAFVAGGDPHFAWLMPRDEWDEISINYTSGTTNPKGVVYHPVAPICWHREMR